MNHTPFCNAEFILTSFMLKYKHGLP